jgi:hypothetical protein
VSLYLVAKGGVASVNKSAGDNPDSNRQGQPDAKNDNL